MVTFQSLLTQPIFLSGVFAWFSAQFIKAVVSIFRTRGKLRKRELLLALIWTTGGMPSSHSAVVSAITVAVGIKVGFASPLFIVCFFFASLAIRDAMGVRQAAGNQARAINQIILELNEKFSGGHKTVKEIRGHKASEVIVGILLGIFIAVAFCTQ
jgi:acid phosphatase family membrane protein YuiD